MPYTMKFTDLAHPVALAALELLRHPGVDVAVTKTTATLTGTPDAILDAARQAFLAAEFGPADRPAYKLLVKVSQRLDAERHGMTEPGDDDAGDDSCPECHADWKRPDPECSRCGSR